VIDIINGSTANLLVFPGYTLGKASDIEILIKTSDVFQEIGYCRALK